MESSRSAKFQRMSVLFAKTFTRLELATNIARTRKEMRTGIGMRSEEVCVPAASFSLFLKELEFYFKRQNRGLQELWQCWQSLYRQI